MGVLYVSAFVILLFAVLVVAFAAFDAAEQESRTMEAELEQARRQSAAMQDKVEAIRRWRHDANGLLQAMEHSLGEGSSSAAQESLSIESLPDGIIEFKRHQCAQQGIAFNVDVCDGWVEILRGSGMEEADVAALLQNLLENAYEATLRIPDEAKRRMGLTVTCNSDNTLSIEVVNAIDPAQHVGFLSRKPSTELHGVGLHIIDDIVDAHHAEKHVEVDSHASVLTTAMSFPLL